MKSNQSAGEKQMIVLSTDPKQAHRELHGLTFYLATFAYIDGRFERSELDLIREKVWKVAEHWIDTSPKATDPAQRAELKKSYAGELDRLLEANYRELTNILAGNEAEKSYADDQLKERCFELLASFAPEARDVLLQAVEELLEVDGRVHPGELEFRQEMLGELQRLAGPPMEAPAAPPAEPPKAAPEFLEVSTDKDIYSFDGRVFERFSTYGEPIRFHIRHLKKIEWGTRNWRGNMVFSIWWEPVNRGGGTFAPEYEEEMVGFLEKIKEASDL